MKLVSREEIIENNYSLQFSTYTNEELESSSNEVIKLSEVVSLIRGVNFSKKDQLEELTEEAIRVATTKAAQEYQVVENDLYYIPKKLIKNEDKYLKDGDILISVSNSLHLVGRTTFIKNLKYDLSFGAFMSCIRVNPELVLPEYLYRILNSENTKKFFRENARTTTNISNLPNEVILNLQIPLPPIEKQQEIVEEIDQYQKIIDGAMQVIDNYKPTFSTEENLKDIEIGELCTLATGGTPKTGVKDYYNPGTIKWLVSGDIHATEIFDCEGRISELGMKESNAKFLPENSVLIALNGQGKTRGSVALLRTKATCNQSLVSIMPNDSEELLSEYLFLCLKNMYMEIRNLTGHKDRRGLNMPIIKKIKIPLVSIEAQKEIVESTFSEIESVRKLDNIISSKNDEINNLINSLYK